jgi:hypothetical protein
LQNGLFNFIRRVRDQILAEVVLEDQLQSAIYEQQQICLLFWEKKSIVPNRARGRRGGSGVVRPEVGPEHSVSNLWRFHRWFVEKGAGTFIRVY